MLSSMLGVLENNKLAIFNDVLPNLYNASCRLLQKDMDKFGDDVLSTYADIAETTPKFLRKDIAGLVKVTKGVVYHKDCDQNLKE